MMQRAPWARGPARGAGAPQIIVDAGDSDAEHGSGGSDCTGDFAKYPVTNY
jgi:hypothetical protein